MMKAKRMQIHFKMAVSILTMMFLFLATGNHLNAQNFYSTQQSVTILKEEIGNLENSLNLTKQQTAQSNLLTVKMIYYTAVLNQIAVGVAPAQAIEDNANLMTATGAEREYSGFTPVSKTEANTIKAAAVDLLSE